MSLVPSLSVGFARLTAIGLAILLALGSAVASAGVSDHLHLPIPGKRIRHGARLELESRWVSGNGYRPVKVTIVNMPPGPTTFDRDFRVRVTPQNIYGRGGHDVLVEAIVEMPEGASVGTAWLAVPQVYGWHTMNVEVREGGDRIEELTNQGMQLNHSNPYYGNSPLFEAMPSVLIIDSDTPGQVARDSMVNRFRQGGSTTITNPTYNLPDVRMWQNIVPHYNDPWNRNNVVVQEVPVGAGRAPDVEILNLISQNEKIEILPPTDLPDQWLHYTCLDLVVISLNDALLVAKQHPKQWEAICRWAASGPTLVVTGMGEDFKGLAELDKLVGFATEDERPGDLPKHGGWVAPRPEFAHARVRAVDTVYSAEYGTDTATGSLNGGQTIPVDSSKPAFGIRRLGLGRVAAMASEDPLENPPHDMAWLMNQVEGRNWMSYQRQGVSFIRRNGDYMTFLIEGTGKVPVWSFLVLITGFVIVIGPVNYLLLKRWRRLFLLLVTVPTGAAIITVSLFSYALISDGLGVRMRARSFTRLDQRTGQASTWARQTYYAGLAPSGGLRFPIDAAVYPIDERPDGVSSRDRELAWNDHQQLRSGYISSRQTSQYLVQCSGKSERKLVIKSRGNNLPPEVVNQLDAPIEHLALRDKDGQYYMLDELAPGGAATLQPAAGPQAPPSEQYRNAFKPLAMAYNERRATSPVGYQDNDYGGGLFGFTNSGRRIYYNQNFERGLPPPSYGSSILERELQRTSTSNSEELEPGTYLVLLEHSAEMPAGYSQVKEQGSFHILEGRW